MKLLASNLAVQITPCDDYPQISTITTDDKAVTHIKSNHHIGINLFYSNLDRMTRPPESLAEL